MNVVLPDAASPEIGMPSREENQGDPDSGVCLQSEEFAILLVAFKRL